MATYPLKLIHMDLFRPTQVKSLSGNRYFFSLVDDFLRFTWVFLLGHMNEAFSFFNIFCKRVENEKEFSILRIRSDRGLSLIHI